jgi:hypothetical protein
MAVTYEPISSTTISGTSTSTITFSSIPQTYTDLELVIQVRENSTSDGNTFINFNSDTGTNYSLTQLYGSGSSGSSNRVSSQTKTGFYGNASQTDASTTYGLSKAYILNYSNSTTYKSIYSQGNFTNIEVVARMHLWRSTAAITRIDLTLATGNYANGSVVTLYGIKAA